MNKEGKVVLITGGGSGFGRAMAMTFASRNYRVLIAGRRQDPLSETAEKTRARFPYARISSVCADLSLSAGAVQAVNAALEQYGSLDVVINNAGAGVRIAPLDEMSEEQIMLSIQSNLLTTIQGCRAAIPYMKQMKSGTIINVSSVCAEYAWPGWSIYSAAKAGVEAFSKCIQTELRPYGVRVGVLSPGASATGFDSAANIDRSGEAPSLRAEDIAKAALLMAELPDRSTVAQMTMWGMNQEVIPL